MIDGLLRDRSALYRQAREGTHLRALNVRLLLLFLLATAIYGGVMGAFRLFHPEFSFSDFELTTAPGVSIQGTVAGMSAESHTFFTKTQCPAVTHMATVRFNLSDPTDAYRVVAVSEEKGFNKIELAPEVAFTESGRWVFPLLVAVKTPVLFLLTLLICALALYFLNLAFGLRLTFMPSMTLMLFTLAGTGVMLVVFAPIALLFTAVTTSYHFMKVLHVVIFIIAGLFGVKILGEGLVSVQADPGEEVAFASSSKKMRPVLFSWLLLYCLVGAQLAWTLKPFLGTPYLPATPPFRVEKGNIFMSTLESMHGMQATHEP